MGLFISQDFLGWLIVPDCSINQQLDTEAIRDPALLHHDSSRVTMETGKPGSASAPVHSSSVVVPAEKKMDIQAPLTTVYIHTVPALPPQPYPQLPAASQEPATLHLAMPPLYSKETLPFLTLHIAGGLHSQQQGLGLAAAVPVARPKSAGKHMCPHCGRDCMKPSVLEKHLRCHTGERPYPCTTCGVSFKTQSNLYKHKRTQAHARLSSESEQSSMSSQDSLYSSRGSLSLDGHSEESGSLKKDSTAPSAEISYPTSTAQVCSVNKQGPDAGWALMRDSVNEQNNSHSFAQRMKPSESPEIMKGEEKQKRMDNEKPALTPTRHLTLQRQEATMFSAHWESSVSRGKSQNHESTDSGFSESSDQYLSPCSALPDHSLDSLTESTLEHLQQPSNPNTSAEATQSGQESKDSVSTQEQRMLEERISKLISENSAVVEDKQLENVRPRKTALSKQGSIDLPMPYMYKDSFHFDMRNSKTPNVGIQRNRKPGLYSSVPTQCSTSMEHAPLTRSSSLPFSVALLQPERSSPTSSYQTDYVTVVRRGSSGQIHPTGFTIKSVDQQVSTHRPLVRQAAVDCNHATEGLFMNSSVEEACAGSLSCDGEGSDICGEPSNRKCRRKKAQKFAYNKWYMYGGGTFKKLYSADKGCDNSVLSAKKSLSSPEHSAVQGIQRRASAVHKGLVLTTGSTITSTCSSATVCHSSCLPVNLPLVSGVDLNQKANQLHPSCTSLKTPLLRNLSLSTLQLSSVGSSDTHNIESISRGEAERLISKEKHSDSISQLHGAHVPSDRKKQRTDDKITCSPGMETSLNTLTQPPTSVIGNLPKQDTNLTYINLQSDQKCIQLKGTLFPPRVINANGTSVSTSPATSIPSNAKTSFLPKYQLKLPNVAEPQHNLKDSNLLPRSLNPSAGTNKHSFATGLSSAQIVQSSPSVNTSTASEKKCVEPLNPLPARGHSIKMTNTFSSAAAQLVPPLTATSLSQSETSVPTLNQNLTTTLAVMHRQFTTSAASTATTHDHHTKLCTALTQTLSTPVMGLVSMQPARPIAPALQNQPSTPIINTEESQLSASAFTTSSQSHHPSLSHARPLPTSEQLNLANSVTAGPNTSVVPCHTVAFDSAAQNVFHVHTADLQICLQLISDEQLALIEPQIERRGPETSLSQRNNLDAMDPEGNRTDVPSCVTMESTFEGAGHGKTRHQKEANQREHSSPHIHDGTKPLLSTHFQRAQATTLITEHRDVSQAATSVKSTASESSSESLNPHGHLNMVTETIKTTGHADSAVALVKGVKSERSQKPEEEHAFPITSSTEECFVPQRSDSQGGVISETLPGQHQLCLQGMTSPSPSTAAQNGMGIGLLHKGSQHKLLNQSTCNADKMKIKCKASVYECTLENGETCLPPQARLCEASNPGGGDALPTKVSLFPNICTVPREVNPQTPVYSDLVDSRLESSEILHSFKHADTGHDTVGPSEHSVPLQDMTLHKTQDRTSSAQRRGQFRPTSVPCSIQVERPKDVTDVLTTNQSSITGCIEGGSLAGCAAQEEPETRGHGSTTGRPDSTDREPTESQEAGDLDHRCTEGQERRGLAGEDRDGGMWSVKTDEEEEKKVEADPYENSRLSEQHHQHVPQSERPRRESRTSNHPDPPDSSNTSLFTSPQPDMELNTVYHQINVTHNRQTQSLRETNSSLHNNQPCGLVHTLNETGQPQTQQFIHNETVSHWNHEMQDQRQTDVALPARVLPQRESCSAANRSAQFNSVKPSSSAKVSHSVCVSSAQGGMSAEAQTTDLGALDNTVWPAKSWTSTYPEHDNKQQSRDQATHEHMTHSSDPAKADITSKYQSLFSVGQLHSYQSLECLTNVVRPVQSCQDYPDDTSSSDDEGKLIIEL